MKYEIDVRCDKELVVVKDDWGGKDNRRKDDPDKDDSWYEEEKKCREPWHAHEFEGGTKLAEICDDPHNHRFAGVSGQMIPVRESHIHKVFSATDFLSHIHFISRFTGPAIPVGDDKHVHFVKGMTSLNDGHRHDFQFATLIDTPLTPEPEEEDS